MPSHKHGTYNRLHDEDVAVTARRLEDIHDQGEVPDSPLRGAVTIQMNQIKSSSKASGTVRIIQEGLSEAGYAAEYERLESELGAGMNSITERPFTYTAMPVAPGTYARRPNSEPLQAHNAQEVAEKTGDIVAVSDIPVDISDSFGGGHFETQNMVAGSIPAATNESQKSYYFPEGCCFVLFLDRELTYYRSRYAIMASSYNGLAMACNTFNHRHRFSWTSGISVPIVPAESPRGPWVSTIR
jgi:hypothetical protein